MKRDISLYLGDIVENIEKATAFIAGHSFETFKEDQKSVYAVIRCMEIIGEAAKHIPEDIRLQRKSIPWRDMAGMRDKLTHGYATVELRIVWTTIQEEIPLLGPQVGSVRDELD